MLKSLEKIFHIIFLFFILIFLAELGHFLYLFTVGKYLAFESEPFSFVPENPRSRILIVGDSTAVGTGSETPHGSVAGKIHRDFPESEIINLAEDGQKIHEVLEDLNSVEGKFDLLIIHAGANDILFMSDFKTTVSLAEHLLNRAKELSDTVVFITSGDLGLVPLLPKPVGWFYSYRTKEFLDNFKILAKEKGVFFVDLYRKEKNGKFLEEDKSVFSPDGLHLNDFGYEIWYQNMLETLRLNGRNVLQ